MSATFPSSALVWPRSALRWRDTRFGSLLVASALLHLALIAFVHKEQPIGTAAPKVTGPLNVRIVPPPPAEPEPVPPVPRVVAQPRLMTTPRSQPSRPALPLPPPESPVLQPPPKPVPAPPMSFADMVAARRAQRAPTVSEHAEARAEAAARAGNTTDASINRNLATLRDEGTSGVFVIVNRGSRYGTFQFRGWKREDWGGWRETIEVDAGLNGDVELAMVRRMIELIRGHYQGNFNWESHRLGRVVILSARPEDTAGLEAFLLREFFKDR